MKQQDREQRLKYVYRDYYYDERISRLRRKGINFVAGKGNLRPKLALVGEAPGRNENAGGEPFVGRAGQVLDDLLDAIGYDRDDIWITNVVKYQPPNNRTPLVGEVRASLPYLKRELAILKPTVVGLMGAVACRAVFPNHVITKIHGFAKSVEGITYVALFHPMVAVYDPDMRDTLLQDFRTLKKIIKNKGVPF